MSDAKTKTQETWLIQKGSVSFNNDLLRRGLSRTGFRGSDKIRNRAIFWQIERQFYSTEIKITYNASQRFCFASVISLNDLKDLRVIEARSLKCRQNIDWPGTPDLHTYHCLNLRSIFHVEFATEKTPSGQFAKENLEGKCNFCK